MNQPDPRPTLISLFAGIGGFDIGMQVRRLTPKECERLQGFPDDHTAGFSDSTRYKMLGNAVCVRVSEWIAKRLHAHIHSTPSKEIAPPKGS